MAAQSAADSCSARFERLTKGGRRIWYDLKVIQQPERARACGSGPKSSADRRPVDPPPVVELHVYEGPSWEGKKDITFHYNANFFLFATLEHARLIAHGRVQTPAANTPPVLSGMPVSGMAYLDRPNEAGYFLFPDLSVRHEGRYRLTFTLYEETKEDKDKDAVASDQLALEFPGGSFDFRMSVQSNDFSVFSAKKFPGLTESTSLSRTVAEQGCRVRIRRDVRMRRRDGKAGGEYDNAEDEYARRRRTETPESHRARSLSNHSVERTPYSADSQRRPSIAEYPPSHLSSQSPTGPYLQFGNQPPPQYPQYPGQHTPQSSSVPPSPSYPTGPYPQASAYPPPPQPYSYPERPPSQTGYRRPSTDHAAPPPLPQNPGGERVQRTSLHSLPPLQPPIASHRSSSSSVGSAAHLLSISSLASPIRDHMNPSKSYSINNILSSSLPPPPPPVAEPRGAKRQRDEMEPHRLVNGARQPPEDDSRKQEYMQYRRANGTTQYAPCGECP